MAGIKFFNINTNETVTLELQPQIAAFINSSNLGINATRGMDKGWRIAPELAVDVEEFRQDMDKMRKLSDRISVPIEGITIPDILFFISEEQAAAERRNAQLTETGKYEDSYERMIKEARESRARANAPTPPVAETIPASDKKK